MNSRIDYWFLDGRELKIDLGCGQNKKHGYIGVDNADIPEVDVSSDVLTFLRSLPDSVVDEIYSRHVMEHLDDFILVQSEIYRVLKKSGVQKVIVPHFSSPFYYSDPTHVQFFGLYSFCYFSENEYYRRNVATFYDSNLRFVILSVRLGFRNSRFPLRNLIGKYILEPLFNASAGAQEVYESFFSSFFNCTEISYELAKRQQTQSSNASHS